MFSIVYCHKTKLHNSIYICKNFGITKTIYSNSERSEQYFVLFLTSSWRFQRSDKVEQLDFELEKNIGI